jgi:hypothetical protein
MRVKSENPITLVECARTHFSPATPLEYALTKTKDLKSFRMNTYRKLGRGYPLQ